jgi:hypothetical protein
MRDGGASGALNRAATRPSGLTFGAALIRALLA